MCIQFSWTFAAALMGMRVASKIIIPQKTDDMGRHGTDDCMPCQWIDVPYGIDRVWYGDYCYQPEDNIRFPKPKPKPPGELELFPRYPVPVCAAVVVKMITEHDDIAIVVIRTTAELNTRERPQLEECKAGRGYQSLIDKKSKAGAYFYDNEKILEVINVCTCNWRYCNSWYSEE